MERTFEFEGEIWIEIGSTSTNAEVSSIFEAWERAHPEWSRLLSNGFGDRTVEMVLTKEKRCIYKCLVKKKW